MRETETQRMVLQKYMEEKESETLAYNSQISRLRKELEQAVDHSLQQETTVDEKSDMLVTKTFEHTQIKQ
jgi:hypothetical protein